MSKRSSLAAALTILGAVALILSGCGGGGGDGGGGSPLADAGSPLDRPPVGNPSEAPAISFTIPAHATLEVARNLPVQVQFRVDIDPASVQPDSIVVVGSLGPVPGSIQLVTGDLLRFFPDDDLPYGDTYQATLRPGIRDLAGQERSAAYTFAFRAVEALPRQPGPHESNPRDMLLNGMAMNQAGDGISLLSEVTGLNTAAGLRFRRIRGGVPTGAVGDIVPGTDQALAGKSGLDVADTGDAQCAWIQYVADRPSAFVRRFNRGSDSWGVPFELTPGPGLRVVSLDAELNNNGGLVAWLEKDVGGSETRAFAGRYAESDLSGVTPLGSATGYMRGLRLSRRGEAGVVAFHSAGPDEVARVQAGRFTEAFGFEMVQQLDVPGVGFVQAAEASFTGHLYVLIERENIITGDDERWYLAVANPGQPFGTPMPLHDNNVLLDDATMAVGDNGVLTVLFGIRGPDSGVWARRYTPGEGLSAAVEITGLGRAMGTDNGDALNVRADAKGNAVAVVAVPSGDGQTIRAALLPVGKPWTVGIELMDEPSARPSRYQASLALEPSGGAFVEWVSKMGVPPLNEVLRTRRLHTDGTLGPLTSFNAVGASRIRKACIALTAEGRGLILYDRADDRPGQTTDNVNQILID